MTISVRSLTFGYDDLPLFDNVSIDLHSSKDNRPLVILGASGCGKSTFLKLLAGLLKPQSGCISPCKTSFMFQESRLLPWLTVLENVSLPLEKIFGKGAAQTLAHSFQRRCYTRIDQGKAEAQTLARSFLSRVFLDDKAHCYPHELSGGQAQRVSMARAFAFPSPVLLMDEPFQSLDIPLRINLMDICLALNNHESENPDQSRRLVIAVTHDPREAIYLGGRILVMGKAGEGFVYDTTLDLPQSKRSYGSSPDLEQELIECIRQSAGS